MDYSFLPWAILFVTVSGVMCYIAWKVTIWTIKKYFPKPTPVIHRSVANSSAKSLLEMKKLLDDKIITQVEFDEYKKKHLENLKAG